MSTAIGYKFLREAEEEYKWILHTDLSMNEKLNELVNLRNYLKMTYGMDQHYAKNEALQVELNKVISKIDKTWWDLFTKGKVE